MNTHIWLVKFIAGLVSIFQASTLRDRYYTATNRLELVETAIEDIERINANSANPNHLISNICRNLHDSRH
jgi:hypothetical protein